MYCLRGDGSRCEKRCLGAVAVAEVGEGGAFALWSLYVIACCLYHIVMTLWLYLFRQVPDDAEGQSERGAGLQFSEARAGEGGTTKTGPWKGVLHCHTGVCEKDTPPENN